MNRSLGDDDNQTSQTSSATVTVYGDGSSASGSTPFITKNEVVSCVKSYARARINNIKVVAAKRTPGPITRVEYVIEVNQNDIIDMLNPLMERLTVEERRALEESIKKGMQR